MPERLAPAIAFRMSSGSVDMKHIAHHDLERFCLDMVEDVEESTRIRSHLIFCQDCLDTCEDIEFSMNAARAAEIRRRLKGMASRAPQARWPQTYATQNAQETESRIHSREVAPGIRRRCDSGTRRTRGQCVTGESREAGMA
jgi:hypothetical protein